MTNLIYDSLIDKVFVFVDSTGSITNVLLWPNLESLIIVLVTGITFKFVADVSIIFISSWRRLHYGKLRR